MINSRHLCARVVLAAAALTSLPLYTCTAQAPASRPNILFIASDDLRPQTGCYGDKLAVTPNMDRLASRGMVFDRAYCQQAVCSPSRTSLLTGLRPDSTRVYDLVTHFRRNVPNTVTLPQHFKNHGYTTQGFGKIYHHGLNDSQSWSSDFIESPGNPDAYRIAGKSSRTTSESYPIKNKPARKLGSRGPAWDAPDVADSDLPDGKTADAAIDAMRKLKDKPFFLAVGFVKPHLPFVAPRKYFDLYAGKDLPAARNPFPPEDMPKYAKPDFGELRSYADIPSTGSLSPEKARELVRGYYAAMSYTDAQVGRLLDELDSLGLTTNTIVVLWGDHGWHLGEHAHWTKHTAFEIAARSPLILSAPGTHSAGKHTNALVEFVDIYPTLCELAGLPLPAHLEGHSMVLLLQAPQRFWKSAAFSQYPRGSAMGYSMKTDQYRYTEWVDRTTSDVLATELYDHKTDPDENKNIAAQPQNKELTARLHQELRAGWKAALPRRKSEPAQE